MAKVTLRSSRTNRSDPREAADHLIEQLGEARPKLVTLFASRERDQTALNRAIRERLPKEVRLLGATTGAPIDRDGTHPGEVVMGALEGDLEVGLGLGRGLTGDALKAGSSAMRTACDQLGVDPRDIDPTKYVGVVIDDGFKNKKEELLMGALDRNQGIILVGGGASDAGVEFSTASSQIHVDGEIADDCAAIAMFRTRAPFAALRHHAYRPLGESLKITKVSDEGNRALEIDGKPAAQRYAEILGVGIEELQFGLPRGFSHKPVAMRVGREHFMRAPMTPLPDGSILFANLLEEDASYELMEIGDMAAMTAEFFAEEVPRRVRNPQAALLFHCGGRQAVASIGGTSDALSASFAGAPPCAGLNVYFEIYCGFHINTTLTSLVFGSDE